MNEKLLTAALTALLFAGCASTPTAQPQAVAAPAASAEAAASEKAAMNTEDGAVDPAVLARTERSTDEDDRVVCRTITPTGSHRKKTICRTVGDIKQTRDSAQDALRGAQGVPTDASD